ncbi:MAG: hypothetical protein WC408_02425 [Candidatus Micrarchaeia archaeon]|jgi:hypothetical protein
MVEQTRRRVYQQASSRGEITDQPAKGKRPSSTGWLILLSLVLLCAFAFYSGRMSVPSFNFGATPSNSTLVENVQSTYGVPYLEYTHPSYGFSVKYPVGYMVYSKPMAEEALMFSADYASGYPVIMKFMVVNETFTEADVNDTVAELKAEQTSEFAITSYGLVSIGSKRLYQIAAIQKSDILGENILLAFNFVTCKDYSLMVETAVPESSKAEQSIFSSIIESINC